MRLRASCVFFNMHAAQNGNTCVMSCMYFKKKVWSLFSDSRTIRKFSLGFLCILYLTQIGSVVGTAILLGMTFLFGIMLKEK